jgi:hypothetical protein
MKISIRKIPKGKQGTAETLKLMISDAICDSVNWRIISHARNVLIENKVDPRNEKAIAIALFEWTKEHINFIRDPALVELIQAPHITLEAKAGDCDDFSLFGAACNMAVGNEIRFITIGSKSPFRFSHVYIQVWTKDGWISYDPPVPISKPGWEVKNPLTKAAWYINGKMENMGDMGMDIGKYFASRKVEGKYIKKNFPPIKDNYMVLEKNENRVKGDRGIEEHLLETLFASDKEVSEGI